MIGELFHIGMNVLSTAVDKVTNTILAQLGSVTQDYVYSQEAEWYQHVGFASRPANPVGGKNAAECIALKGGTRDAVIASRDVRGQLIYGNLKEGETAIYAGGADGKSQGRILIKQDGSISLYTRTDENAKGMIISITPSSDTIAIVNSLGYGLIIDRTGVTVTAGDKAALSLKASGDVSLIGTGQAQVDGGGIVLGSTAVPGLNSALTGPTGIAGVASTKVLIATA